MLLHLQAPTTSSHRNCWWGEDVIPMKTAPRVWTKHFPLHSTKLLSQWNNSSDGIIMSGVGSFTHQTRYIPQQGHTSAQHWLNTRILTSGLQHSLRFPEINFMIHRRSQGQDVQPYRHWRQRHCVNFEALWLGKENSHLPEDTSGLTAVSASRTVLCKSTAPQTLNPT